MKRTFQTLVIGASMAVGMSAIATAPAHAADFTFNNLNEINTYTGGSNGTFIRGDAAAATKALTDQDASSNVELWYSTENPTSNVGFTATQGKYSATVTSVTADDWKNFSSQWLGDLLSNYKPFQSVWNGLSKETQSSVTNYFPLLGMGDPNIGGFQFGENGGVELKLVGHLDVKAKLSSTISALLTLPNALTTSKDLLTLQAALNTYQGEIGASEIAKVVTGDKTYYAYSFSPTASGITASDDGISYSAIYTWKTPGYVPSTPVPEPSVVLGILSVAGIRVAQRKLKKVSA